MINFQCYRKRYCNYDVVRQTYSMATAQDNHTKCFVFDDILLNYQHVWLKFLQYFMFLLFYIPFKICKPSFNSIDIMAVVYKSFDNPS